MEDHVPVPEVPSPTPGFHPDLTRAARVGRSLVGPRTAPVLRLLGRLRREHSLPGVTVETLQTPAPLRVYRPLGGATGGALLWLHGGGLVLGRAIDDDAWAARVARELGVVVASVDYRLAPAHPFPAALDDCYAEDLDYARRLQAAGVTCTLDVVPGAFHGFDIVVAKAGVSKAFRDRQLVALRSAIGSPASRS